MGVFRAVTARAVSNSMFMVVMVLVSMIMVVLVVALV